MYKVQVCISLASELFAGIVTVGILVVPIVGVPNAYYNDFLNAACANQGVEGVLDLPGSKS